MLDRKYKRNVRFKKLYNYKHSQNLSIEKILNS